MSYATLLLLSDRYGERMLIELTDRSTPATGAVDADVVARALADTDAVVDGYNGLWNGDSIYVGSISVATEPLCHGDGRHGMGHAWTFARNALDAGIITAQKALLVPVAVGGTPIDYPIGAPGYWGAGNNPASPAAPGGALYENAITQALEAYADAARIGYDPYFAGVIWHQGESNQSTAPATFQLLVDAVFEGLRERLGVPDLPIICGSFIYEIIDPPLYYNADNRQVLIDAARRLEYVSFYHGPGPGYQVDAGSNFAHFNADGQRVLANGAVEAFEIALANSDGALPLAPRAVNLEQIGDDLNVWWRRPLSRVTRYEAQYSVDGGAWVAATIPNGPIVAARNVDCGQRDLPAITLAGITEGSTYQVRVRALNDAGTSAWTTQTLETVTLPDVVASISLGTATQSTLPLTWSAAARAASYTIEISLDEIDWDVAATGVSNLFYTIMGLDPATLYYVRITSDNAAGSSSPSSSDSTTTTLDILDDALSVSAQAAVFGYYSVSRRVKSAYTGNLIRVRRASDNAEQDIGQTAATILDEAALASFLGSSDGYLKTVYDQSGSARNVSQANAANQPRIAIAGVLVKVSGRPAADQSMDAVRLLENTTVGLYAAGAATVFAVLRATAGSPFMGESATGGTFPRYAPVSVGTSGNTLTRVIQNDAGTIIDASNTSPQVAVKTGYHCVGVVDTGASLVVRQDGSTTETKAITRSGTFANLARFGVGGIHMGSTYSGITGYWGEMVMFTDDLADADRDAIEANMAAWYGTAA